MLAIPTIEEPASRSATNLKAGSYLIQIALSTTMPTIATISTQFLLMFISLHLPNNGPAHPIKAKAHAKTIVIKKFSETNTVVSKSNTNSLVVAETTNSHKLLLVTIRQPAHQQNPDNPC
jgi:hypothetical protein